MNDSLMNAMDTDNDPPNDSFFSALFAQKAATMWHVEKCQGPLLERMAHAASDHALREALATHQEECKEQIKRLGTVFSTLDRAPTESPSPSFDAMAADAESLTHRTDRGVLLDAELIYAGRRLARFAIDHYGVLFDWARQLDLKAADLIEESLDEEQEADRRLFCITTMRMG